MYIVHFGSSGFPSDSAQMQRVRMIFKSLKIADYLPLVINKYSVYKIENLKRVNSFQGIPYISTSALLKRPDNLVIRTLNKLTGYFGELMLLMNKYKDIEAGIFYSASFIELIYYRMLSRIFRFRLIVQRVEMRSSIDQSHNILKRTNDRLFDNYYFHFCDGIIVISQFLLNQVCQDKCSTPAIKIPAICDFDEFQSNFKLNSKNYLMYCGSINYLPVIEFVIDLYCKLREAKIYNGGLLLVVAIDEKQILTFKKLEDKILFCKFQDNITLETNIPRCDLIQKYCEAELLIIPLRNTIQDIARFSHKVGEYTAAKRPIVSTNIGELNHYFEDGVSAILASDYSIDSYVEKLSLYINSKDRLSKIGEAGNKIGIQYLNYRNYSLPLSDFIKNIHCCPVKMKS